MRTFLLVWGAFAIVAAGCSSKHAPSGKTPPSPPATAAPSPFVIAAKGSAATRSSQPPPTRDVGRLPRFVDVAAETGLRYEYVNGARGESIMVETVGGGCGMLDYDGDHHRDFYLTQGGDPTRSAGSDQPTDRLFRNLGQGQIVDVTPWVAIEETYYGQGVAIGDFDDDGFDDVYVTNVGRNALFHNQGDGTFVEVTESAGVGDRRWSTSAAWADITGDGLLDLYVCNYVQYDPLHPLDCRNEQGKRRICHPRDVEHWPDECFINQGDGTFTAEAQQRGLYGEGNKGLGVVVADFNNDRFPDIYVANDTTPNFLFHNNGDATFREEASLRGCAVDRNGARQASMGLGVADFDNNGYLDIYSTHFYGESNTLYANLGEQGFKDVTGIEGLHEPTLQFLGFGTNMADFNLDGHMDVFVTNGHVENNPENLVYKMEPQLFTYAGSRWTECSQQAGEFFAQKLVGRGVASCDYDDDGDLDLVVVHHLTPTALLRNDARHGHWLKMRFIGTASNRRGIGVRVTLRAGDKSYMQELCGGTSYLASNEPILVFGLGQENGPVTAHVRWPSGVTQTLENLDVDQSIVVEEPPLSVPSGPSLRRQAESPDEQAAHLAWEQSGPDNEGSASPAEGGGRWAMHWNSRDPHIRD
jgi:hypothetical protein